MRLPYGTGAYKNYRIALDGGQRTGRGELPLQLAQCKKHTTLIGDLHGRPWVLLAAGGSTQSTILGCAPDQLEQRKNDQAARGAPTNADGKLDSIDPVSCEIARKATVVLQMQGGAVLQ